MKATRLLIIGFWVLLFSVYGGSAMASRATDTSAREYKLKAAFMLNFSKFTTWPKEALAGIGETFDFCIVGKNPFGNTLDGLETKKVGGIPVKIRYFSSISEVKDCDVLFISKSEKNKLEQLQKIDRQHSAITVSDIKDFSKQGGMFEFITKGGRLSFVVNNKVATQKGLQINASLLSLAVEVL